MKGVRLTITLQIKKEYSIKITSKICRFVADDEESIVIWRPQEEQESENMNFQFQKILMNE